MNHYTKDGHEQGLMTHTHTHTHTHTPKRVFWRNKIPIALYLLLMGGFLLLISCTQNDEINELDAALTRNEDLVLRGNPALSQNRVEDLECYLVSQ